MREGGNRSIGIMEVFIGRNAGKIVCHVFRADLKGLVKESRKVQAKPPIIHVMGGNLEEQQIQQNRQDDREYN